ncbi:MAG: hypothetical protein JXB42_11580 [Deltaproteobacteria bacterium]|nr:hypothetical protein [Deltaproteobacteria bacterium]
MFIENHNLDVVQKKGLLRVLASIIFLIFLFVPTAWTSETRKFYVKMPSPCYEVKRVGGSNVYLESTGEACMQVAVRKEIAIDSSVKKVSIYADGEFWAEQNVEDFNMNSIRDIKKSANDLFDNLKVHENKHKDMAGKYAAQTKQYYESKAFQKKCKAEAERLKAAVFKDQIEGAGKAYSEIPDGEAYSTGTLPSNERIYVFISSSMPEQTLRNYVYTLDRLRDPNIEMVMRGFVGGIKKIAPTLKFMRKIISKPDGSAYSASIIIDPILFRKYGVGRVPCVVYDRNVAADIHADADSDNYYLMYGDTSLEYVIERIQKESQSEILNVVLASLRGDIYK